MESNTSQLNFIELAEKVLKNALKKGKLKKYEEIFRKKVNPTIAKVINGLLTANYEFADALNLGVHKALKLGKLFNRIDIAGIGADMRFVVYYELGKPASLRGLAVKTPEHARRRYSAPALGKNFIELLAQYMHYIHEKYLVKKLW